MARNAALGAVAVAMQLIKNKNTKMLSTISRLRRHHLSETETETTKPFQFSIPNTRFFSSHSTPPTPTDPSPSSEISLIHSVQQLQSAFQNVQDEELPAVFYFTAVWCSPCKFMTPVIQEMANKYPHVKCYKIDIDQEGLGDQLTELKITSVPTFHFFENGKFAGEMVGADRSRFKKTMEKRYELKTVENGE